VRFLEIPSVDDSEIAKMVEFQTIKEIPYPRQEMIISYRNLGSYKEGFSSIMLVVARRPMIEKMMDEKGLEDFNIKSIRLHSELLYLFLLKEKIIRTDKVNFIIHIGKEDSELMIIDKTRPIFSRGFKDKEGFLKEVDRSILAYEKNKGNPEIENVIVTYASNVDIEDVKSRIEGHFSIPVSFYEYAGDLTSIDPSAKIELLPGEITDRKVKSQRKQEMLVTYSLIGFVMILFFTSFSFKIYEKRRFLRVLSSKRAQMQSEIDKLYKYRKKTLIAKDHRKRGRFIIDILGHSYGLIPVNISLLVVSYDGKKTISYKGTSRDMANILAFVKKLEKSEYFYTTEIKYATKKKVKGEEITDFNIQCQLKML